VEILEPEEEPDQDLKGKGKLIRKHSNMIDTSKSQIRTKENHSKNFTEKTVEELGTQEFLRNKM
jgi:hypothetical protein